MKTRIFLTIIVLIILTLSTSNSQMLIAPTAVYLDESNNISSVIIQNRTPEEREVVLDLKFGYPATDSNGKTHIVYNDSLSEKIHSLISWVKLFPKKMIMKPEEKQIVRIMAKAPLNLLEGMYWARMAVISKPKSKNNFDTNSTQIGAQINLTFNQVIPIIFKKGDAKSALSIGNITEIQDSSKVRLVVDVKTDKATPFIGTGKLLVKDLNGKKVSEINVPFTVYYHLRKEIVLDCSEYPGGNYKYSLELESKREDVQDSFLAKTEKINSDREFTYIPLQNVASKK